MGRLALVSGTGTGIGKTHFSEALLLAVHPYFERVAGIKPIETGLSGALLSDSAHLERASTFHVQQSGYLFADAVSPHLAAREAGETIDLGVVAELVQNVRSQADFTLVELPGGLFTPLSDSAVNADLVNLLEPETTLLVACDRLGVLHEVLATTLAARSMGLGVDGVVLVNPPIPDSSTGRNVMELTRFSAAPLVVTMPRRSVEELASDPAMSTVLSLVLR